jgi:uncharacterized protein YjbI with pentapeptide repeats
MTGDTTRRALEQVLVRGVPLADRLDRFLPGPLDLASADLANLDLRRLNLAGAKLAGANLAGSDLTSATLTGADLSGANLESARLDGARLAHARLSGARLAAATMLGADLDRAQLRGACLRGADLGGASLRGADLMEADLRGARLVGANFSDDGDDGIAKTRLSGTNLGGADLAGARMPPGHAFALLDAAREAAGDCGKVFLLLLAGLVHAGLTLAATADAQLLPTSSIFPLPVVQTQVPVLLFYVVAPLLLTLVFLYLQISLNRLCARTATLPSVLPDGTHVTHRFPLSMVSAFAVEHGSRAGSEGAQAVNRLNRWIALGVMQAGTPLMIGMFWWRYQVRHDLLLSVWHAGLLGCCVATALAFAALRRQTLLAKGHAMRGVRKAILAGIAGMTTAVGVSLMGSHSSMPAHLPALAANVARSEISTVPANWDGKDDTKVRGAALRGLNLRFLRGAEAFLVKADLEQALLEGADLRAAKLEQALLTRVDARRARLVDAQLLGAKLDGADLRGADLRGSDLRIADLYGAWLDGADLRGANMEDAQFLKPEQLQAARTDRTTIMPNGERGPFAAGRGMEQSKTPVALEDSIHVEPAK